MPYEGKLYQQWPQMLYHKMQTTDCQKDQVIFESVFFKKWKLVVFNLIFRIKS